MLRRLMIALAAVVLSVPAAHGQLAITEVMSSESSTSNGVAAPNHPDWWELSNFGTNDIDLSNYSWNDNAHGGLFGADNSGFPGVIIHPNEAIIITESNSVVGTAQDFRDWWGLAPGVQVIVSGSPNGLGAGGDSVRLWTTNNLNGDFDGTFDEALAFQADRIDFGVAIDGRSFVYNTNTGTFSLFSTNGVRGAFKAVTADDEGSPGIAPPPAPIVITQWPTNVNAGLGDTATFRIGGRGLPRPTFQWLFQGSPVDESNPAVSVTRSNGVSTLKLMDLNGAEAGNYSVLISNGVTNWTTTNVVLTVNTNPIGAAIVQAPASLNAYLGQTASFTVQAIGNPRPTFQWKKNSVILPGETNPQLLIPVSDTNQSGVYSVVVSNALAFTNASATLVVTPKPYLLITEVMSSESTNAGHADWWELSNFGNTPVDLHGFRMNDSHPLTSAYTITNQAIIQPGESVVFLEVNFNLPNNVTPQTFRTWWGSNLPPGVQIIGYDGTGRGLSASADEVRLWNQAATDEADRVTAVSFSSSANSISFTFDPQQTNQLGFVGNSTFGRSTNGINGAFVAAVGGDVGSPGRVVNWPVFNGAAAAPDGFHLAWSSQPNWDYFLQYKDSLADAAWLTLTNLTSTDTNVLFLDTTAGAARFYRVGSKANKTQ